MICKHCQHEMPLRSFRPPPSRCVYCEQLQDPYLPRSNFGCLVLTPIAILSALVSGYIALQLGRCLVPVLQIPDFDKFLAVLAAFDALGLMCVIHVKRFRGPTEQYHSGPVALSLMYFAIGLKCALGMGIGVAVWTGSINSVVLSLVTVSILRFVNSRPETRQLTK